MSDNIASQTSFFPHHPGAVLVDILSAGAIVGTFLGYLPIVAAFAGLVWYLIQIWESRTIQHWWNNRRIVRTAKKIAKLKAKERVIMAQLEGLESIRHAKIEARDKVETAKIEAAKTQVHEETAAETKG